MTGIVRRAPLRTAIRAIAGATVVALAAACGSAGGSGTAGTPDHDADLRIAYAGPVPSLDPAADGMGSGQVPTFLLYDRLTQMDNDLRVKPMLATSWAFAPDGSYLQMTLRKGVTFHDGTPLDATAVKATLERNKRLPGSTIAPALASIASVDVVDPLTVRLNLVPGRGAELPAVLASNAGEIMSPKALTDGRDLGLAPGDAGSGPYVVAGFRPNEAIELERAPGQHWDPDAAKAARVEISYSPQGSTRLNALRAGQIDVAQLTGPDIQTARELAGSGGFDVHTASIITPYTLYLHADRPPFTDPRVRQAINTAIDRKAISDQLLAGTCEPRVQAYPKNYWPHVDALDTAVAANPAKAKELLAGSDTHGARFALAFTAGSSFEPIAQVIQSQLAAVGITVDLAPLPSAAAFAGYRQGQYPAYLGAAPTNADPAELIQTTYLGGFNGGEAVRDAITPIANRADDPTLTQAQRGALYGQIWTEVAQQASLINICASSQMWAHSPNVTGIDQMPGRWSGYVDLRHVGVNH